MKTKLLLLIISMSTGLLFSQSKQFFKKETTSISSLSKANHKNLKDFLLFSVDANALKQQLLSAPDRSNFRSPSNVIISVPNYNGKLERFTIKEASTMHPDLQVRYPEIRSYIGQGIDNPSSVLRFSLSPAGLSAMILSNDGASTFIEPTQSGSNLHIVFNRKNRTNFNDDFECLVTEELNRSIGSGFVAKNADDAVLRTYRLAVSATGEYTQYHGGTKAQALAAMNTTMTRVNGIYETDFNVTLQLIATTDAVIYTSTSSDPYGNTTSGYNSQLQNTLTSVIGEANYDIGHLFANLQNNGNAGCIGCVCVNGQKGSGWTSHVVPEGDPFDVDYVAHEMGHQFGGNHTWTFGGNEGANAQMEPGSGSTIMGYAGITGPTDVQSNSDPYFHARSIEQVTNYIKTTSCQTNTNTGNSVPTVNAGLNYTIPRGTAFVLEGSATDADSGDALSYCWEQYDENNAASTNPSVSATSGVAFRSFNPTSDSERYFPRLATVKTGVTAWQWEAVPNVARNLNFRLTVRDNQAGGGTNNSDDMRVTVNGTAGPFVLNTPNTNVTWDAGTSQTVTWNVAGTTGNGVNAANVDIFLSTDGGDTYPIPLATTVSNDGSHTIVVPNNQGSQNRIMVRGSNNIFFDISNANFTIGAPVVCSANVPTGLTASNISTNSATLNWDAVSGASYDLRYRSVGATNWITTAVTGISSGLTGLSTLTEYEAQIRSKCSSGSNSVYSSSVNFTTTDVQLDYCDSASTNVNDEYISRVQLNTIDNSSGPQFYSDFTGVSTVLTKDTQYTIEVTPTWTGTVYSEAYAVWIDYNRDGDFNDVGEQVFSQSPTQATAVSGSFTVPTGAVENVTRMRVSMKYNALPAACETFQYGEVEDYTIIIEGNGPDTETPVISLNGGSTLSLELGDNYTELGATATDNIDGDLTSSIVIAGDTVDTNTVGSYFITYNVSDVAGNAATEVIRTVVVNADTTAPIITLIGPSVVNLNVGDMYNELGATATDNLDGDISTNILITGFLDTAIAGTYFVNYNVSDASGNTANQVTRTVNVTADTSPPVIVLVGAATVNLDVGDAYNELGATATDNLDGNLTNSIVIASNVNTNTAGSYAVTYNVSDSAGNAAVEVIRTVNVSDPSFGCASGISTFPYTEGFEGAIGTWSQSTTDDLNWLVDAGGTPSANTGPSSAVQGSDYIFVEASVQGTGYPDKRAIITSPCFDLGALTSPIFSFKYHMFGASDMGSIALEVSDDDGASWTSLWSQTDNQGNQWLNVDLDVSVYAGRTIQLRFNRFVGSTWQADIAIDDVQLFEPLAATCTDGIQNGDETGVDCGGTFCQPCNTAEVVLNEGFFETGLDSWVDGGSDCARVNSANSFEGNFSVRIRDNSGVASSMTLPNIDVTAFTEVEVDFYFYVFSMENGEDFWLRFFDGSAWNTAQTWTRGVDIENNTFYNATVSITPAQYNFAVNSGFRFQNDASGNQDQIFIDQVVITGKNGTSRGAKDKLEIVGYGDSLELSEVDLEIYPNPVKGDVLYVSVASLEFFNYSIIDMVGKTVLKGKSDGKINVSALEGGIYFIKVNDGDETLTKKFIKS
ncbi:immunoglobulin-like domain-containing protein [uncultured Winogradskyella sp.]|uniref:immunoglobulin-like domain-containing protein n=1 Tax=uncultured Winogradskyella sp. TaxID=395353 RepID=UPI0030DB3350|tara:strand:- start:75187 stop:79923 length:4737 start_codon:yes stop_codon:yes gene_type:complete